MRQVEKAVLLQTLDHLWREHLVTLDHLRQVIGFRGYAQRDPLNEYKTESFELFQTMLSRLREAVTVADDARRGRPAAAAPRSGRRLRDAGGDPHRPGHRRERDGRSGCRLASPGLPPATAATPPEKIDPKDPTTWGKVQRNAPCPCGSGKKYKHCHGRFD